MSATKDVGHWRREEYTQRMTTKEWREILLAEDDSLIFHGRVRKLVVKNLGSGVVEISKQPLEAPSE